MAGRQAAADGAALKKLKQDLKEGAVGQLYVFHGEESYLRDFYLGQLRKKLELYEEIRTIPKLGYRLED